MMWRCKKCGRSELLVSQDATVAVSHDELMDFDKDNDVAHLRKRFASDSIFDDQWSDEVQIIDILTQGDLVLSCAECGDEVERADVEKAIAEDKRDE